MGCAETLDTGTDIFADAVWGISPSSGSVQLMELIDPAVLYSQHHFSGTIGGIWAKHHKKFGDFILSANPAEVLEVGGASGQLAKVALESNESVKWTIIEPSPQDPSTDDRLTRIQGFFEEYDFPHAYDAVVHSHVFEHVYNPMKFLQKIASLLNEGSSHFIALPNMRYWLEHGFSSALTFEHTYYLDEQVIEYLMAKNGFTLKDKIVEDHSMFFRYVKDDSVTVPTTDFAYIKDVFMNYVTGMEQDVAEINTKIKDNKIYLFGAHIFSQTLLNLGINEGQVVNILDNDPKKQEHRLYGTNLIVKSPECLKDLYQPIIIVRGASYTDEIKESILRVNPTAIFY
jgi:SAM-dependent methyltransferase